MANEIERWYAARGLHGWSLHPGGIGTGLQIRIDFSEYKKLPEIQRILKSPEQGAAMTLLAAVDKELEGKGGKFLDDCAVSLPVKPELATDLASPGYAWAYDEEAAKKLWTVSSGIVGVEEE